jgi:purine-binding chemotaxis protein CheW
MLNEQISDETQFLTFMLAGEEYGIRILQVKEIIAFDAVTKVPKTPDWILGVINLRGSVVPVVDLSVKFSLGNSKVTKSTCIVIVEVDLAGEQAVMGVMADAVDEVLDLPAKDIEPTPAFGSRVSVDYLQGLGKSKGKFILLLDINRVLSTEELLEAVSSQQLTSVNVESAAVATA